MIAEGRDEIHDQYAELFDTAPDLTAETVESFAIGAYVAVKERVTGAGPTRLALAIYRVRDGEIRQLWLGGE